MQLARSILSAMRVGCRALVYLISTCIPLAPSTRRVRPGQIAALFTSANHEKNQPPEDSTECCFKQVDEFSRHAHEIQFKMITNNYAAHESGVWTPHQLIQET
jgi:hypothetical protein